MEESIESKAKAVQGMFASIAQRYDLGNSVLSFGVHYYWRRRLMALCSRDSSGLALDVATGTGDLLPLLAKRFTTQVVGLDFCLPMLRAGQHKSAIESSGAIMLQGDGLALPFADNVFENVTVSFGVRNFADLQRGLSELARVVRPGGRVCILEFGQPRIPVFAQLYQWYSAKIMPFIGGLVTGNRAAYVYLPQTAKEFPCGPAFEDCLKKAGLRIMKTLSLTGGIAFAYAAEKVP